MTVNELIENLKALNGNSDVLLMVDEIQTSPKDISLNVVGALEEITTSLKDNTVTLQALMAR